MAAKAHRQATAASEAAAAVAYERLAAIRTVRSFNQEAAEGRRRDAEKAENHPCLMCLGRERVQVPRKRRTSLLCPAPRNETSSPLIQGD